MRRVLHLTDSWGPGGAETVFADVANGLDTERFQSFAGLPRASDWLHDEMVRRGMTPRIFPTAGAVDVRHVVRLSRAIRELRIDVVQAHTFGTSVYASLAGAVTRVPTVCTLHGRVDLALSDRFRKTKWAIIRLGATRVIAVSTALREELLQSAPAFPADRVDVIYNGVDTTVFHPGYDADRRAELGVGPGEILVGAVGNVRPVKGYEVLLEAAAALAGRGLRCKFAIIGQTNNAAYEQLRARSTALGLDDVVRFAGFRRDVPELYRSFDIYVITSHSEGFPLSTIQALSSGLPVVATRCGGPEEMVVDGVNGWLVERGSGTAVADGIERLVQDPVSRDHMGAAARETALNRFSTSEMIRQYEELYEAITPGASAAGAHRTFRPVQGYQEALRK